MGAALSADVDAPTEPEHSTCPFGAVKKVPLRERRREPYPLSGRLSRMCSMEVAAGIAGDSRKFIEFRQAIANVVPGSFRTHKNMSGRSNRGTIDQGSQGNVQIGAVADQRVEK